MPNQPVDPEHPRHSNAFDQADGYSGEDYTIGRELAEGAAAVDPPFRPSDEGPDLPPDQGQRASIDPRTGEVHGAGAGAGGGNEGEDFDTSSASGDTAQITGGEGTEHRPPDLGPRNNRATYL